jgi:hypothetical protein
MDSKDIRNLQEAYLEVYQELDEAERPLPYGRMMKKSNELADSDDKKKRNRAAKIYLAANAPKGPKVKVREDLDLYDIILSHLLDEGYATSEEAAEVIMVNMSEEWRDSIIEATAMAKRGLDEPAIRQQIAASTGGGAAADRATALEKRPTYGDANKQKQRERLARSQRGDFRSTTSSSPGLHGYAHKPTNAQQQSLQAARGAQRGVLTSAEKKQFGR